MDEKTFNCLSIKPKLSKSTVRLFPYMSQVPLETLRQFITRFKYNNSYYECEFQVVVGKDGCILGDETSTRMGL